MSCVADVRSAALRETDSDGGDLATNDRLVVLPGIELSLGVPCQALLIFDADFPDDRFSVILEALAIGSASEAEATKGQVNDLEHIQTLAGLYEVLDQREWL
jgi:chromosome segregation protein